MGSSRALRHDIHAKSPVGNVMGLRVLLVLFISATTLSCRRFEDVAHCVPNQSEESRLLDFERAIQGVKVGKLPADLRRDFLGCVTLFNRRLEEVACERLKVHIQVDPGSLANPFLSWDLSTLRKQGYMPFLFEEVGITGDVETDKALAVLNLRQFFWLITCIYRATVYRFDLGHPVLRLDTHPVVCPTPADK